MSSPAASCSAGNGIVCIENYETFMHHVQSLEPGTLIKSWEIFNRYIVSSAEGKKEQKENKAEQKYACLSLPKGTQALADFLKTQVIEEIPEKLAPRVFDEQFALELTLEVWSLPEESSHRQMLVEQMNQTLAQNPQLRETSYIQKLLSIQPAPSSERLEREKKILQMSFLLPSDSPEFQALIETTRANFEAGIPHRVLIFQSKCQEILASASAEHSSGVLPLEHKVTLVYAHSNSLDTLKTISYHKTFAN